MRSSLLALGIGALGVSLAIGGCASAKRTYLPSGQPAYAISCGSLFGSWRSCLVKAGELCGSGGYTESVNNDADGLLVVTCNQHK